MTSPGKRFRGSAVGLFFSFSTLKVKLCRKLVKNKNNLFLASTSPGQTLNPAPKGNNLNM